MKKKIALVLAVVLLMVATVGGTLAWLTDSTEAVTNTFSTTDIDVTLTETFNTDTNNDGTNDKWQAQMIPGYSYTKDPKVTVSADSVDCYLFVKFEENNSPSNYLTYTSTLTAANGWTQGTGTGTGGNGVPTNVWYRVVKTTDTTRSWELLSGNTVTVDGDKLTKDNMPAANAAPTLTYTAYVCQLWKSNDSTKTEAENQFSAKEAWEKASTVTATGNN